MPTRRCNGGRFLIYLDNAATTIQKPPQVKEAVCAALSGMANSARGAYGGSLAASRVIYETREKLAQLFDFDRPERVCFTQNATEALNTALSGLFSAGDHVISTVCEHNSVLRPLYRLQQQGVSVSFVKADKLGRLAYEDFAAAFTPRTKAIVCMHASNLTGNVFDLQKLSALAHKHGAILIADCSQTAGQVPISMKQLGMDVLCFTGHKGLMGPQGTGGILVGENVEIRPLKLGGTGVQTYLPMQPEQYPEHLEAGTLNGHGIAGLSAAVSFLLETGVENIQKKEAALMRRFYEGVQSIPQIKLYGDFEAAQRAPIVSLNLSKMPSDEPADILWADYGICVRAGAHCAPKLHEALGTKQQGAVRFSFGYYNTVQDVDAAIAALREIQKA